MKDAPLYDLRVPNEQLKLHPTILFDGVCGLCDRSVGFVIRHDPRATFRFCPLQSPAGQALLRGLGMDENYLGSVVLIDGGRVYTKSTAALKITRQMPWPWRMMSIGLIVPRPIRDWVYGIIVRNRYRWFGRRETCRMPTTDERSRFIEANVAS